MASQTGNMATSLTMDTASSNGTAIYPLQAHYGPNKTYNTIYSGGTPISALDPMGDPTDVSGVPTNPVVPPVPQPLPRTGPIVGIVNTAARGVYFEGTLVPVIGDGVTGIGAVPSPRILTTPGKYSTIFIGTRT